MTLDCESLQFPAANATSEAQAELNPAQLSPEGVSNLKHRQTLRTFVGVAFLLLF